MSLSRRKFTKEFKLAAVQPAGSGGLDRRGGARLRGERQRSAPRRREFRDGVDQAFPGLGRRKPKRAGLPNWSGRLASRRWRSIF